MKEIIVHLLCAALFHPSRVDCLFIQRLLMAHYARLVQMEMRQGARFLFDLFVWLMMLHLCVSFLHHTINFKATHVWLLRFFHVLWFYRVCACSDLQIFWVFFQVRVVDRTWKCKSVTLIWDFEWDIFFILRFMAIFLDLHWKCLPHDSVIHRALGFVNKSLDPSKLCVFRNFPAWITHEWKVLI